MKETEAERGEKEEGTHAEAVNCTNFCCLLEKAEVVTSLVGGFLFSAARSVLSKRVRSAF